jgi:signal transduction histidine kinase
MTGVNIEIEVDIPEEVLTDDKKSIIYRIIKDTLRMLSLHKQIQEEIHIALGINEVTGNLQLSIQVNSNNQKPERHGPADFDLMKENTILSGGEFSLTSDASGVLKAVSEWESI